MTISEVEAHSRAVVSLQALLSKYRPGSSHHRIAERALDLAFNGSRARGGDFEQELLEDAQQVIDLQVRAKLLGLPTASLTVPHGSLERDIIRTRYLAWRGTVRKRVADRLVQAELWLSTEGGSGDGHALRL